MSDLRNRGWSIDQANSNEDSNADNKKTTPNSSPANRRRPRANTDHSEQSLTAHEKLDLLNDFPTEELDRASHHDEPPPPSKKRKQDKSDESSDNEEDMIQMFGEDGSNSDSDMSRTTHDLQPSKKRRKIEEPPKEEETDEAKEKQRMLELAKSRLSKWSARLFDPDRPRGLVEAPEVIPLNDEFLTEFGKRTKDFNENMGLENDVEEEDLDSMTGIEFADDSEIEKDSSKKTKPKGTKVKIQNLSYTTGTNALTQLCEKYGALLDVNLVMDEINPTRSKGRAYVIFQHEADAQEFVEKKNQKDFGGRPLRIGLAKESGRQSLGGNTGSRKSMMARYWEKDITTKCFRCGGKLFR